MPCVRARTENMAVPPIESRLRKSTWPSSEFDYMKRAVYNVSEVCYNLSRTHPDIKKGPRVYESRDEERFEGDVALKTYVTGAR